MYSERTKRENIKSWIGTLIIIYEYKWISKNLKWPIIESSYWIRSKQLLKRLNKKPNIKIVSRNQINYWSNPKY